MSLRLLLCCLLLTSWPARAYQYAFPAEPRPIELTAEQNSVLERLWALILAFQNYPDWIESMESAQVVKRGAFEEHRLIWVDYELARFWISLKYRLVHEYWPAKNYLRWTLDPDHVNDLDRVDGYWHLLPHPTRPGWSRVYYSAQLTTFDWLPDWVQNLLAEEGLDTTSRWLKDAVNEQNPL